MEYTDPQLVAFAQRRKERQEEKERLASRNPVQRGQELGDAIFERQVTHGLGLGFVLEGLRDSARDKNMVASIVGQVRYLDRVFDWCNHQPKPEEYAHFIATSDRAAEASTGDRVPLAQPALEVLAQAQGDSQTPPGPSQAEPQLSRSQAPCCQEPSSVCSNRQPTSDTQSSSSSSLSPEGAVASPGFDEGDNVTLTLSRSDFEIVRAAADLVLLLGMSSNSSFTWKRPGAEQELARICRELKGWA